MNGGRARPIRVMFVDDHALVRAAVRNAVSAADVEVVAEASTAEEALLIAPEVQPDVLLVDIDLPGMDGLHLVRELAPRLPDTRILMLTVSTDDADIVAAMRFGAAGYLTKDLAPEALLRAIRGAAAGELAMSRATGTRLVRALLRSTDPASKDPRDPVSLLTERESEVLRLLARGLTDREIGKALTLSTRTVGHHVSAILRKLGARNRAEAVARYPRET